MRKLLSTILLVTLVFFACQKGNSPGSPGGGSGGGGTNPPPPPPGGTSGGITITGISPLSVYQGDTITLTGTGFDADKTKDTVVIGALESLSLTPYFKPGGNELWLVSNSGTRIVSATATQIKFTTDASMSVYASEKELFALKISAPGKSMNTGDTISMKTLPKWDGMTSYDPQQRLCYSAFAGDSLSITGLGFYPPLKIEINGKTIDYLIQQPDNPNIEQGKATVTGFIGIDFFGTGTPSGTCDTAAKAMTIRITNGDGKVCEGSSIFFPGPNSKVIFVSLGNNGVSQYEKSKAGSVPIVIHGYALRDITLEVDGSDPNGTTFQESLGAWGGDITGDVTTSIDIGSLPTPSSSEGAEYNVWVKDANGARMGGVHFTLFP